MSVVPPALALVFTLAVFAALCVYWSGHATRWVAEVACGLGAMMAVLGCVATLVQSGVPS